MITMGSGYTKRILMISIYRTSNVLMKKHRKGQLQKTRNTRKRLHKS